MFTQPNDNRTSFKEKQFPRKKTLRALTLILFHHYIALNTYLYEKSNSPYSIGTSHSAGPTKRERRSSRRRLFVVVHVLGLSLALSTRHNNDNNCAYLPLLHSLASANSRHYRCYAGNVYITPARARTTYSMRGRERTRRWYRAISRCRRRHRVRALF